MNLRNCLCQTSSVTLTQNFKFLRFVIYLKIFQVENELEAKKKEIEKLQNTLRTSEVHLISTNREFGETLKQMSAVEDDLRNTKAELDVSRAEVAELKLMREKDSKVEGRFGPIKFKGGAFAAAGIASVNGTYEPEFTEHKGLFSNA